MTAELQALQEQLSDVMQRLQRLEEAVIRWNYLVPRPHPWRKQLSIKGRNMTVGQLVSTVRANKLTPEEASEDLDLPVEAIREALAYYEENRELIQREAAEERRWLAERGYPLEPKDLPR